MIEVKQKEKCSGCGGCANVCPQNAIDMLEDKMGFLYPVVDKSKCNNCRLCEKICPILNRNTEVKNDIKAYACYNRNEQERLKSSSGGLFILFAKEILKRNGVVFGACFDDEFSVIHSYTESETDLYKFMGSKYVQSKIGDSYRKVKEFLESDRYVLFTGTPCQIEGLSFYLRKKYKKLYTQDIICHGVPSPLVWEKYKAYRLNKDCQKPLDISFRNKDNGWQLFNIQFLYKNNSYNVNIKTDLYMQTFIKNTSLRDSCYSCSFKKKNRISDITLADYWGIENIHSELYDNRGISLLIINSSKGQELFNSIAKYTKYRKTDLDNAIIYNTAMTKSVKMDINRDLFFKNLNDMSFSKLVKKYTKHDSFFKKVYNKLKSLIKRLVIR